MGVIALIALATAAAPARAQHPLGPDGAFCAAGRSSALVEIDGFRDRIGAVRVEVYPLNKDDFLSNHKELVAAGKPFRRVIAVPPASGPLRVCLAAPIEGAMGLAVIHARGDERKFKFRRDGIGFANNPKLGWGKPEPEKTRVVFNGGVTRVQVTLNYFQGLNMRPWKKEREERRG